MRIFLTLTAYLCLVILAGCSPREAAPPTVDSVLDRYIAALGGRSQLEIREAQVIYGHRITQLPSLDTAEVVLFQVYARPGNWTLQTASESFGVDARGGWYSDGDSVRADSGKLRSKLAYVFDPQGPLRLGEYFSDLRFGEFRELEYRQVTGIRTDRTDTYYTLWFDRETALLNGIGFHWNLLDYRPVAGVLMPHIIAEGRKGGAVTYYIDSVRVNAGLSDSEFARPVDPRLSAR